MCGLDKKVEDIPLSELKQVSLLNTDEKIPTFKEVLNLIDGRVPLIIEYKYMGTNCNELCEKAWDILTDYTGKYVIESFNPMVLNWFRTNKPAVMRGQLAMVPKTSNLIKSIASLFLMNFLARPDFVAFDHTKKEALRFKFQKFLGAFPVGWTFQTQQRLNECKKDFKAYIFENFNPY